MNHKDLTDAVRQSEQMADKRSDRHNVYSLRARQQENAARLLLYPVSRAHARVENVTYLHPRTPDDRPAA